MQLAVFISLILIAALFGGVFVFMIYDYLNRKRQNKWKQLL